MDGFDRYFLGIRRCYRCQRLSAEQYGEHEQHVNVKHYRKYKQLYARLYASVRRFLR